MAFLEVQCEDSGLRRAVERLLALEVESRKLFAPFSLEEETPWAGRRIGPYRILSPLGRGGMGVVYRAQRENDYQQDVALKLIRWELSEDKARRRFLVERQALAKLRHPNIARLYDGGSTEEGFPYLVMELIEGDSIDRYCDERELSIQRRLELFVQVCQAVDHAHRNRVVHCDIKASNVLVESDGVVKLLDFGIAKWLREDGGEFTETVTGTGDLRPMTPSYASPEQVLGGVITTATDIYSLGMLLYRLLCGRLPYDVENPPFGLAGAILEQEPRLASRSWALRESMDDSPSTEELALQRGAAPAQLRRQLQGDLDAIVLKALAKEPGARYRSAEDFALDIERHLEGVPVLARGEVWGYRLGRRLLRLIWPLDPRRRRERWVFFGAFLVLVCALGAAYLVHRPPPPCGNSERWLTGLWDPERQEEVQAAFLDTGAPFAESTWNRVERRLTEEAEAWVAMHTTACEATRIHGEQSEAILDARMTCLESRRRALGALVDLFDEADVAVVVRADAAFDGLGSIERCADLEQLTTLEPLPEDESVRSRIQEMEGRLEVQRLNFALRRPHDAEELDRLVARAQEIDYAPLLARAHFYRGKILGDGGMTPEAGIEDLETSLVAALAGGDRHLQPRIYAALTKIVSVRLGDLEAAERWSELALASLEALGSGWPTVEFEVADALGILHWKLGDEDVSLGWYQAALEQAIEMGSVPEQLRTRTNLGLFEGQRQQVEEALQRIEEAYGANHVLLSHPLLNLASFMVGNEGFEAALPKVRRSAALIESTYGESNADLGYPLLFLGQLLIELDRPRKALETLVRTRRVLEKHLGSEAQIFGDLFETLAEAHCELGQLEKALEFAALADPVLGRRPKGHISQQELLALQLELHLTLGNEAEARQAWRRLDELNRGVPPEWYRHPFRGVVCPG